MSAQENTARASTMFGNYDILETLGQGGMGVVYRAHDVALDREVAVKVLKEDLRSHPHVAARFQREAEAFAKLNHPNIVHIYSVGSVGKIPYIAMEYIEGQPLSKYMRKQGRVHWKTALNIAEQIAAALDSAHQNHIIHRDIKPANILIDSEGRAFVTDFGIAKVLTAEIQLTLNGSRLGTPQYMSPERCQNRPITPSSDLYSLGIVLFQMISGHLPYQADTPVSLIRKITTEPPARLSDFAPNLPEDVVRLVAYLIEKDPSKRPASAAKFVEMCIRVREGGGLVEDDSGLASAIGEMRGRLATPTAGLGSGKADSSWISERLNLGLIRRWRGFSESVRTVLIGVVIIAMAGLAGLFVSSRMNRDFAIATVRGMGGSPSRWQQSMRVAQFIDDTEGVLLSSIDLLNFKTQNIDWLSADDALVHLEGDPASYRRGSSAYVSLSPSARHASLYIAPQGTVNARDGLVYLSHLGRTTDSSPGALFRTVVSDVIAGTEPALVYRTAGATTTSPQILTVLSDILVASGLAHSANGRIGPVAVDPSGGSIAIAVGGDSGWTLLEGEMDLPRAPRGYRVLARADSALTSVQYAPDGSWIAYTQQIEENAAQLWTLPSHGAPSDAAMLIEGDLLLLHGAISPDGERVAVAIRTPSGRQVVRVLNTDSGAMEIELDETQGAVWHPSGAILLTTTSDRRGTMQLWAMPADSLGEPRQLTFQNAGNVRECSISPDGAWAVAMLSDTYKPSLIFVDLRQVSLKQKRD